jgi:hypothetical protein
VEKKESDVSGNIDDNDDFMSAPRRIDMLDLMRNQRLLSDNCHTDLLFLLHQITQSKKTLMKMQPSSKQLW